MQGRLDMAIDRTVREMLDVEPPAGLRGRVLDRIESPRRGLGGLWIAAPAAAAMLILAMLAPWRQVAPPVMTPAPPSIAKVEPPPVMPPSLSPKTAELPRGTSLPLPYTTPPAARRPAPRLVDRIVVAAVAADNDAGTVIDPLAPIAPIVAVGTHPQNIAPKDIAISPMAPITQLQIAPLSPPERRN